MRLLLLCGLLFISRPVAHTVEAPTEERAISLSVEDSEYIEWQEEESAVVETIISDDSVVVVQIPNTKFLYTGANGFIKGLLYMAEKCENKYLDPNKIHTNDDGSVDRGIPQLNSIHDTGIRKEGRDPLFEPDRWWYAEHKIHAYSGWKPWSCHKWAESISP